MEELGLNGEDPASSFRPQVHQFPNTASRNLFGISRHHLHRTKATVITLTILIT